MDFEEYRSLTRRAEELARPTRLLRDQLGLDGPAVATAIHEVNERVSLASQFMTGIGGAARIRELSDTVTEWHRQEKFVR